MRADRSLQLLGRLIVVGFLMASRVLRRECMYVVLRPLEPQYVVGDISCCSRRNIAHFRFRSLLRYGATSGTWSVSVIVNDRSAWLHFLSIMITIHYQPVKGFICIPVSYAQMGKYQLCTILRAYLPKVNRFSPPNGRTPIYKYLVLYVILPWLKCV